MAQTNATRRRDQDTARERAAQLRAAQQRRERRRRAVVVSAVVAVVATVAAIVVIGVTSSSGTKDSVAVDRSPAPAAVLAAVTGVPAATLDAVGAGTVAAHPKPVGDAALTTGGKPRVLYVGAEFCPYCAGSRWALVQALSRFGSFSGLGVTTSSSTDVFPGTATFTFHGASYTSDVVAFDGHELETRTGAALDTLGPADNALWHRYTGQGSFPFLAIGGRFVEMGQSVNPAVLKGLSANEIAGRLADPAGPVAKEVLGSANLLTAAICSVTGNKPAAVCTATGVVAAAKALNG